MRFYKQTKRFLLLLAMLSAESFADAQIKVEASETVELMSIISRTAGFREYCMDMGGKYTEDTEAWFSAYKDHPSVSYFKDLRVRYNIGYDAVMTVGINLAIDNGKLLMLTHKDGLGNRWKNVDTDTLVAKVNQFYTDTHFHDFYQKHKPFYSEVLRIYEANVMQYFHQDWYATFYGTEPTERFRVVIGFTCGGGNYGPSRQLPDQPKEVFAICGYYVNEQNGKAYENGIDYAATLIHEFNHSFVNRLLDNETNNVLLVPIGKKLLKQSYHSMTSQAYRNAETVINESIVRAAVILYLQDCGFTEEQIKDEMYEQISRGFYWMPELVTSLRYYSKHRSKYPTLNDYYPQIAKAFNKYLNAERERVEKAILKLNDK